MGTLRKSTYSIRVQKGEDEYYIGQCLELPAAISQGKTQQEAVRNTLEAIKLVLEDIAALREKNPAIVTVEV